MRIPVQKRDNRHKSMTKRLRYTGQIPAILYQESGSIPLVVDAIVFQSFLRSIKKGTLATTALEIDLDGTVYNVLVKGIEYHPVTENILHLDFQPLVDGRKIQVKVPVMITNPADSLGVKMGGIVKMVKRGISVCCEPKHIPESFLVDITALDVGQVVRLEALQIDSNVNVLASPREILVAINK